MPCSSVVSPLWASDDISTIANDPMVMLSTVSIDRNLWAKGAFAAIPR